MSVRRINLGAKSLIKILEEESKKGKLPPKILIDSIAYSKILNSEATHKFNGDEVEFYWRALEEKVIVRKYGETYRLKRVFSKSFDYKEEEKYSPVTLIITG